MLSVTVLGHSLSEVKGQRTASTVIMRHSLSAYPTSTSSLTIK